MSKISIFSKIVQEVVDRSRDQVLGLFAKGRVVSDNEVELGQLTKALVHGHGEVSGVVLAQEILREYATLSTEQKADFFRLLHCEYDVDMASLGAATERYRQDGTFENYKAVIEGAEPPRQELFRRLNFATNGTKALIDLRSDLLAQAAKEKELERVDLDLVHLLSSWFNRGFLEVREINWDSSASLLEKIIRYEAVHSINSWSDLRQRVDSPDRYCFGFFHPALDDEPLIFVEVALTKDIPSSIGEVLDPEREPVDPAEATTAVFYSISNCQEGLRGVSFGAFLIKQVVAELKSIHSGITQWVTLSPVPGFGRWIKDRAPELVAGGNCDEKTILPLAAEYFFEAKSRGGKPRDPVARFHLNNGATLHRLLPNADLSAKGRKQSLGLMVNYLYELDRVPTNHEAFTTDGKVVASPEVTKIHAAAAGSTRDKD